MVVVGLGAVVVGGAVDGTSWCDGAVLTVLGSGTDVPTLGAGVPLHAAGPEARPLGASPVSAATVVVDASGATTRRSR
jgi:hypothetical protein